MFPLAPDAIAVNDHDQVNDNDQVNDHERVNDRPGHGLLAGLYAVIL